MTIAVKLRRIAVGVALAFLVGCASAAIDAQRGHEPIWVGAWASSQQIVEPENMAPPEAMRGATLRQIVRLSQGGATIRVRLSNAFGTAPLRIVSAHVAHAVAAGSPATEQGTDRVLTFAGETDLIIPAGADYLSDVLTYPVEAFDDLAISILYEEPPAQQTGHPGSRTASFLLAGDHLAATDMPHALRIEHWYQLSAIDVTAMPGAAAIVTLGDSITDGRGSTTDGNNRWPDMLAQRLQASPNTRHLSVLNHGVGGNRLLDDGKGPNALARFDRDVLAQTGARYVIILEGVNDLGVFTRDVERTAEEHAAFRARVIAAYDQIITRAHARGVKVIGATILPYGGGTVYLLSEADEADRQAINDWIRNSGRFDAVADFDALLRDPEHPDRLLPAYDTGDRLHPSPAGFRVMADAVPLEAFR